MNKLIMMDEKIKTYTDIKNLIQGGDGLEFKFIDKQETYTWIEGLLKRFNYLAATKKEKGLLKKYLIKMTGYCDRQTKRLITHYHRIGHLQIQECRNRNTFERTYSREDLDLLIKTDELHNRLNGLATKKIFETEYLVYKKQEYRRLARISIAHIYNLRKSKTYREKSLTYTKTNPRKINIGERRRPDPQGEPGYIRVDTVHQGDLDKAKGVYHINAVDEVTQWQIVVAVEKISEAYLVDALEQLLTQFPFKIFEFHSDNGGEYINANVALLLNRLLIKLTKSRARQTNDNALVESKNGSVIRKWMGYTYIPQKYAEHINKFYKNHFNDYVNYFRPSIFPEITISKKNKETKKYKYQNTMTPFTKLKSIKKFTQYLKPEFPLLDLESFASQYSINEFTERMVKAQQKLFNDINS